MVAAAVLRFIQLENAPAGGHGDVSWIGINALDWVDRGVWQFYVRELYSPEFFPVYLTGLLLPITGVSQLPQRLITAVSGVLLVFSLFWAAWWLLAELPDRRRLWSALAAAAAGALSVHAAYLSRLGMESPPFVLTVTLLVWAWARAWNRGGFWAWGIAGFLLGLNQYIYLPARLLPVMIILWLGFLFITQRARLLQQWRGIAVAAVVAFLVTLPALLLFLTTPAAFSGRADAGSQETGGWIWLFDTAQYGGVFGVILQKLWLTLAGVGVSWNAEYTMMGNPMLTPLFFAGFIAAVILTFRYWRLIAFAWCWLAIPVLLITDLISGGVPRVHALHQMGILPFVFILSGVGLGFTLDWLFASRKDRRVQVGLFLGVVLVAVVPSVVTFARYLNEYVPAQYRDPNFYWSEAQADLDLAHYLNEHRDQTFLLPISEYTRPDVAWFVASGFRQRQSAIDASGQLVLPTLPEEIVVVMPEVPERPRHDGHPAYFAPGQWALLHDNTIYLLPQLPDQEVQTLMTALDNGTSKTLTDRSGRDIFRFVTIERPDLFSTEQSVITYPLDATFDESIKLLGYSASQQQIEPGAVVDLTLYFQALEPLPEDYEVFAQLWNDDSEAVTGVQVFPYSGMYRSRIWDDQEIVPVPLWFRVPDDLVYGRYTLMIGLYRYLQGERLPVSGQSAVLGDGIVAAPDFLYPLPQSTIDVPADALSATFGDTLKFTLLSAEVNSEQLSGTQWDVRGGDTLNLNVVWEALKSPAQDYSVFLHLAPVEDQPPLAQSDTLIRSDYPTGAWRTDDQLVDTLTLVLPPDLPAGEYELFVGVYYWQTGERLTVNVEENQIAVSDNRVRVASINVTLP